MDTTHTDELLQELEESDPASAPDAADRLASALAQELEDGRDEGEGH